jgi:hypothetical protein
LELWLVFLVKRDLEREVVLVVWGSIKLVAQINRSCGHDTNVVDDFSALFATQFGDKVVKSWDDNAVHADGCVW